MILAVLLPLFLFAIPLMAAPANTLTVCPLGCDYAAIQPAINAATPGDTILIAAGAYTGQLTLKSGLALTAPDGPTDTVVTALASPIISGSNLVSVTLTGLSVRGNAAITAPIGLDLAASDVSLSNVIIADLQGATGTAADANGADAIGLRVSGQSNLTITHSILQNIAAGDGLLGSGATGGDALGVQANGSGSVWMVDTTIQSVSGGKAGTLVTWSWYCTGAGGSAIGVRTDGDLALSIADSTLNALVAGEPCRAGSSYCVGNAGTIRGVETNGGTLILSGNTLSNFSSWAAWNSAVNYAVHVVGALQARLERNQIAGMIAYDTLAVQRPNTPDSPYCDPPPSSFIDVELDGGDALYASDNSLRDLTSAGLGGQTIGIQATGVNSVTLSRNTIANINSGASEVSIGSGIRIDRAVTADIDANRIEQLHGGHAPWLYYLSGASPSGGSVDGINLQDVTHALVTNNIIWSLTGGNGGSSQTLWGPIGNGGDATALNVAASSAQVWNNTLVQTTPGYGVTGGLTGTASGVRVDGGVLFALNNIVMDHGVAIAAASTITPQLGYNDVWRNTVDYTGTGPGFNDRYVDPKFVDLAHGDFHLAAASPLIDAGFNPGAPDRDFDGLLRPLDGNEDNVAIADIGAYEYWWGLNGSTETVTPWIATSGQTVTYRITLVNHSQHQILLNVTLTDPLPIELQYVTGTLQATAGMADYANQTITWLGMVAPDMPSTLVFDAVISPALNAPRVIHNQVTLNDGIALPLILHADLFANPLIVYLPIVRR